MSAEPATDDEIRRLFCIGTAGDPLNVECREPFTLSPEEAAALVARIDADRTKIAILKKWQAEAVPELRRLLRFRTITPIR